MVRLMWISIGLCALALVALAAALYRVDSVSDQNAERFAQASREAIVHNCQAVEDLKRVMREIMAAVIVFNETSSSEELRARAATYRKIVAENLAPSKCSVQEGGSE